MEFGSEKFFDVGKAKQEPWALCLNAVIITKGKPRKGL